MTHVDYKKVPCLSVDFKKVSCRPVKSKKSAMSHVAKA